MTSYQFPSDFLWGVATAAYQIEGAIAKEGRKPSVWDTFSAIPERVRTGDTGAIACDHYHRFAEDIALMARFGIRHYRFSIAWPRILPDGTGAVNQAGIDFYKRLVDCLLEHGITPHATLFHWDSPQALEDRFGSWRSREMSHAFADYTTAVVNQLGDRITNWMTINEIHCFTHLGYAVGQVPLHAPGTTVSSLKEVWQTSHHALLAHGLACQAIRAASPVPCQVSIVDNVFPTVPIAETPEHIAAAIAAMPLCGTNGGVLYPILTGAYSPALLEKLGNDAPDIQNGDMAIIQQPLDRLGLNLYSGFYVRACDREPGYELLDFPRGYPKMHLPWLNIVPDCIYWAVRHIRDSLNQESLPIFITENGCAADDEVTPQGEVLDSDRILYLREYLRAAHRAVNEGYPLKGYFLWSWLDNFEWSWGYSRRFGLNYIDYPTQTRTPKASAYWYAECIKQNRVV